MTEICAWPERGKGSPRPDADRPSLWLSETPLVLASGSESRRALLAAAGLVFEVDAARIDERDVEETFLRDGGATGGVAARLARAKAAEVSLRRPRALCLGADQTLLVDGAILHKPSDIAAAERHLRLLAGREHQLVSAFAFACGGEILFEGAAVATLVMRPLDHAAIELYLALAGAAALRSVGAYQVEGLGVHLFESIEGGHTAILGLPLLPVLSWLRAEGYLAL
jgi:septum formation protein